jgi:hypothetical protein
LLYKLKQLSQISETEYTFTFASEEESVSAEELDESENESRKWIREEYVIKRFKPESLLYSVSEEKERRYLSSLSTSTYQKDILNFCETCSIHYHYKKAVPSFLT